MMLWPRQAFGSQFTGCPSMAVMRLLQWLLIAEVGLYAHATEGLPALSDPVGEALAGVREAVERPIGREEASGRRRRRRRGRGRRGALGREQEVRRRAGFPDAAVPGTITRGRASTLEPACLAHRIPLTSPGEAAVPARHGGWPDCAHFPLRRCGEGFHGGA